MDAAMLQFLQELPESKDAHTSVTNSAKIDGAKAFQKVLLTLGDAAPPRPARVSDNLPGHIRDE